MQHTSDDLRVGSQWWVARLVSRVSQVRSRLDFIQESSTKSTEDRILAGLIDQLVKSPFAVIAKGINTARLDDISPGLRSKANRRFGQADGLASFALTQALRPDRSDLTDELISSASQALLDPGVDHEGVLLRLGTSYFNAVCDDPCLTLQTFAWLGAHESAALKQAFVVLYESLGSRIEVALDIFLADWGRAPREGTSSAEIVTALTSLIEGLAMRTAVDPDSVSSELPATACVALVKGLTRALPVPREPLGVE